MVHSCTPQKDMDLEVIDQTLVIAVVATEYSCY
jgi:hypothetical protein